MGHFVVIAELPSFSFVCYTTPYSERGRRHQKLAARARQMVRLLTRWLPDRQLILVGDGGFAALELLHAVSQTRNAHLITHLRLDAELCNPAPSRKSPQSGRPRVKGARRTSPKQCLDDSTTPWTSLEVENCYGSEKREVEFYTETCMWNKSGFQPILIRWVLVREPQGQYDPQAFLSTCVEHRPEQILSWFVRRWRMEVTFEETRAHLGMVTQRQWSDLAIAQITPVLLGLFSMVKLMADRLIKRQVMLVRTTAWCTKTCRPSPMHWQ